MDLIDEAGACAQLHPGKLPEEVIEVQKRIRFIVHTEIRHSRGGDPPAPRER